MQNNKPFVKYFDVCFPLKFHYCEEFGLFSRDLETIRTCLESERKRTKEHLDNCEIFLPILQQDIDRIDAILSNIATLENKELNAISRKFGGIKVNAEIHPNFSYNNLGENI